MVAMSAIKAGERSVGSRALSVVAGLAFLGYGVYLGFIFDGGSYMMFFQAFVLPALLIVNFIRSVVAKQTEPQPFQGGHPQQYQADPAQGQPFQGDPAQAQQYQAGQPQQYQAGAAQPQPYQGQPQGYAAGPNQPGPTQPS
jgi:hypothetical protein